MILMKKDEECCGCTACASICPGRAIVMEKRNGFHYPKILQEKCTDCGRCSQVCPVSRPKPRKAGYLARVKVYAAKNRAEDIRNNSSSGGIFVPISDYILKLGGVVYGAKYDDTMDVIHCRAEDADERNEFMGSKYVQSDLKASFLKVEEDLNQKKQVLFSGTPCQIAGLYNFLGNHKYQNNLFTIDLICHGAPSPVIFKEYRNYLEKKHKSFIRLICFRWKGQAAGNQNMKVMFQNGEQYVNTNSRDIYYRLFLYDLILRPSCYQCKWTSKERVGDISLGDFWGIENYNARFDDGRGVSLIYANTEKGQRLLDKVKDQLAMLETEEDACRQRPLYAPPLRPRFLTNLVWHFAEDGKFQHNIGIITVLSYLPKIKYSIQRRLRLLIDNKGVTA